MMRLIGWDFEVDGWSRFWRWNMTRICVWTCDVNSTLGSVVPLAMFIINVKPRGLLFSSMSRNWKVEVSLAFLSFSNSLWTFLFRKLSISKFKLQVSFSLGSFVSGKIVWNALSPSFTYLGASWLIENNCF